MSDAPAWFGGGGTILVAVVAVWTARRPDRLARKRRPVLEIEYGDTEPLERPVWADGQIDHYLLRLRVKNTGDTTAKGVRTTVEAWWSFGGDKRARWVKNDLDPFPPCWVGSGPRDRTVDLPPSGQALFDLMRWDPSRQKLYVVPALGERLAFRTDGGPYGEQLVTVAVTADNAEGVRRTLSFTTREGTPVDPSTGKRRPPLHDVHFAEEPDSSGVIDVGYLALLSEKDRPVSD